MTKYSLSEIDALSRKATRGAGYSWGVAEEVGKTLRWLSAYGFSGAEILSQHLLHVADQKQSFKPNLVSSSAKEKVFGNDCSEICSLTSGALLNDLGHLLNQNIELSFRDMSHPILALPAAGRVAEAYNVSIAYRFDQATIICNPNGIVIKDSSVEPVEYIPPPLNDNSFLSSKNDFGVYAELDAFILIKKANVNCRFIHSDYSNTHFPSPESRAISKESIKILEMFAHSTYAPATEESRLRGAG